MEIIDTNTWERKQVFEHFSSFIDPYFGLTIPFNVTKAYHYAKNNEVSFFVKYYHDCLKAINLVENLKYRIVDHKVVKYQVIHGSTTIMRENKTYGFSFIKFNEDLNSFIKNFEAEKQRINQSNDLFPPTNSLDCIHSSAIPWINFTGEKQPVSGKPDSVPKFAFGKAQNVNGEHIMNVSIHVNHALVDGYHVGLFAKKFQQFLNQ
ncbi:chloramphenicol acetyltransferase [Tamlana sedimentorum]|uniref:Chloramphenicol acetyltransferase n=1 Tax=Neotamlana sedimentorum TaxID=1435349 RepID=A0A0D7WAU1_9FLAO|nr:CatA-like O-acetyltransferase [Tamlana sedimentorum]KJD36189.1 chloramphenicol acetyltransferase [Tamlana sedimentorum]